MNEEMNVQAPVDAAAPMDANGLLDLLRGNGLDDEAIEVLLSEAIQVMHESGEQMPENHDEKQAGKLLGVEL